MDIIDLRSDTVTKPTPSMRRAMAEAEVGDDVYFEDPTVNRLQERAAEILGKEAALFVPSGTMGNQICVRLNARPGTEAVVEARSHIFNYEMGGAAAFSGVTLRPVAGEDGLLTWDSISGAIHHNTPYHVTPTSLVALENSHNMAGGSVTPTSVSREICERAHSIGLRVHLDGARIFNAAIALDTTVAEIARRLEGLHQGSDQRAQDVGRRNAAGGRAGRRRPGRARRLARSPDPRPREREAAGRGAGRIARREDRSRTRANQHRDLRHRGDGNGHGPIQRRVEVARRAGQRRQRERDANGDALRREPRTDRADASNRSGDSDWLKED